MLPPFGVSFDLPSTEFWVTHSIAVVTTVLVLLASGALYRVRSRPVPPPAVKKGQADEERYVPGRPGERRSSLRRRGKAVLVYLSDGGVEPFEAWVVNRSASGLCLLVDRELAPDTPLLVRAVVAPETSPWVEVRVVRSKEKGTRWEIGCQFVDSVSWSELLLFG